MDSLRKHQWGLRLFFKYLCELQNHFWSESGSVSRQFDDQLKVLCNKPSSKYLNDFWSWRKLLPPIKHFVQLFWTKHSRSRMLTSSLYSLKYFYRNINKRVITGIRYIEPLSVKKLNDVNRYGPNAELCQFKHYIFRVWLRDYQFEF